MRTFIFILLGLTVAACLLGLAGYFGMSSISYQGQSFKLTKRYWNYDDYKNDPFNLKSSEIPRIQKLMTEYPIRLNYEDETALISDLMNNVKFPGFGSGTKGMAETADGRNFVCAYCEIPRTDTCRFLTFEYLKDGTLKRVDDFIHAVNPVWMTMVMEENTLVYLSPDKSPFRRTELSGR